MEKVIKIYATTSSKPNAHLQPLLSTHVQNFKIIRTKLYEEMRSQGTLFLDIYMEAEIRKLLILQSGKSNKN